MSEETKTTETTETKTTGQQACAGYWKGFIAAVRPIWRGIQFATAILLITFATIMVAALGRFALTGQTPVGALEARRSIDWVKTPANMVATYKTTWWQRTKLAWSDYVAYEGFRDGTKVELILVFPKRGKEVWVYNQTDGVFEKSSLVFEDYLARRDSVR